MLFNDGPEATPFMVTVEMDGGHRMGGGEEEGGKEKLPFEVCSFSQVVLPAPELLLSSRSSTQYNPKDSVMLSS